MLLNLLWLAFPAYLIMQVVVLRGSSGGARLAAGVPLIFMTLVIAMTIMALAQNSNLWPLLLLFSSPVALLYVGVVFAIQRAAPRPSAGRD